MNFIGRFGLLRSAILRGVDDSLDFDRFADIFEDDDIGPRMTRNLPSVVRCSLSAFVGKTTEGHRPLIDVLGYPSGRFRATTPDETDNLLKIIRRSNGPAHFHWAENIPSILSRTCSGSRSLPAAESARPLAMTVCTLSSYERNWSSPSRATSSGERFWSAAICSRRCSMSGVS